MDRMYLPESEDRLLTPHFKLSEMTFCVGDKLVLPNDECLTNLIRLCREHLEPLRSVFGPIYINSGYRDLKKNIAVGGAKNSYHLYGCACDIPMGSLYWGLRFASYLLVNNDSVRSNYQIAELILHKKQNYIHLAMRKDATDLKFYIDIL